LVLNGEIIRLARCREIRDRDRRRDGIGLRAGSVGHIIGHDQMAVEVKEEIIICLEGDHGADRLAI
jgi:D-serine deaminase-like pyridoxal phosphate-dependent protein